VQKNIFKKPTSSLMHLLLMYLYMFYLLLI